MRAEIKKLQQRLKTTTVYVTHDQIEAMTMGQRIAVMKDGKIQQVGTPLEIYGHPENLFVANFIGTPPMNFLAATVSDGGKTLAGPGFSLPVPSNLQGPTTGKDGLKVMVGVRPEHVLHPSATPRGETARLSGIVEVVEPLAMFALIGLALAVRPHSLYPHFIGFVCIALVLSAFKRLDNAIVSWTDLLSLPNYIWLNRLVWTPLSPAAWVLAWNRWSPRASRSIDGAALVLAAIGIVCGALQAPAITQLCRYGFIALFGLIAVRMVRCGPMRLMAVVTMALILAAQFSGELRSIGLTDIWFPFGIGVTLAQYAYAVAIPLLAVLIVQSLDPKIARVRDESRRFKSYPL